MTENVREHLPESRFDNPVEKEKEQKPDEIEELIQKLNAPAKKAKKSAKKKEKAPVVQEEKPVDPEKADDLFDALNNQRIEKKNGAADAGYDKKEREELDKLFLESVDEIPSGAD